MYFMCFINNDVFHTRLNYPIDRNCQVSALPPKSFDEILKNDATWALDVGVRKKLGEKYKELFEFTYSPPTWGDFLTEMNHIIGVWNSNPPISLHEAGVEDALKQVLVLSTIFRRSRVCVTISAIRSPPYEVRYYVKKTF